MSIPHKVLIVDDHPMIIDAYRNTMKYMTDSKKVDLEFKFCTAEDCDSAIFEITKSNCKDPIKLALLDIRIPPSGDKQFLSGECIALHIQKVYPDCKIIIFTSHNDNYRLHDIFKTVNPDGFLIKTDINSNDLMDAIYKVITGIPYYSKTILDLIRKQLTEGILLDEIDRKLLHEIASGMKTKDLPNVIPLSIAGIERRKRKLKTIFEVENKRDQALLQKAKEKGYI